MHKYLYTFPLFIWSVFLIAQPTTNQSIYDLQFAEEVVDCEGDAPNICVSIQIKSNQEGESFRIGSHTIFFSYNGLSIQSPSYTSSHFDDSNLCITDEFAAYHAPAFSFDANTAEANFTTIAQQGLTEQLCPLVTDEWQEMGIVCFEVIDDTQNTNLQFDASFTTLNYIDPNASNSIGDPQDKAAHSQGELLDLDVLPICPCNQSIDQAIAAVQEFCESGTPDLTAAESEIVYSGDGSVFTLEWFIDVDYTAPYVSEELNHSEIDICAQESFMLYAKATCSIDNTEYDAGTLEVKVYPAPQMPEIMRLDDDCAYVVMPVCENDVLSEDSFNLMPSAEADSRNIEVTSLFNAACTANFEVPYEKCPDPVCNQTIIETAAGIQSFCGEGMPDLALAESAIQYSDDGSVFLIEWFEDEGFNTPYIERNFNHSQADLCAIEQDTLFARATCNIDQTLSSVGFLAIELYPSLQSPTIVRDDETCAYTIRPFCENDALSETSFELPPDSEASSKNIEVTSSFNEACNGVFEVEYEACPALVCDQSITQTIANTQRFCESGIPNLTLAEAELMFSGDGSSFLIEWFEDENFVSSYVERDFSHSQADFCTIETDTLFVRATCSIDNSVTNAGFLLIELHPVVRTPEIVRIDDACSYLVQPFCESDLLSETTFSLPPSTESGNRTITVTSAFNENCNDIFEVAYEACPELICNQNIVQTIQATQNFCESGTPDLSLAEAELVYSGDGSVFSIEWFEDESFTTLYNGQDLTREGSDNCSLEEVFLYARATCNIDNSVYQAGVLKVVLYLVPQMPNIFRDNDLCEYRVVPFCSDDVLSITSFNQPPNTEAGTLDIEVTSGFEESPCSSASFDVPFEACPELICSQSILQTIAAEQAICESGSVDLEAAEVELMFNGDGEVFTLEWFEDENFSIPFEGGDLSHSMGDACQLEIKILYAQATCSDDNSVQSAGTLEVELYPSPQKPFIQRLDDECTYRVVPACSEDVLSESSFELSPDSPDGSREIFVTSGIENSACDTHPFEVDYTVCPPAFCDLEIVSVIPSLCDSMSNTYSLEVTVTYGTVPNAPISIMVGDIGGGGMIDGSGEQVFMLENLPADGEMGVDVAAGLVIGNICVDTLFNAYDAPLSCAGELCDMLEVGELPSDNQFVCFGDVLQINHMGAVLPEGTALVYILHSVPQNALSAPLYISTEGTFDLEEIPNILVNIPYYISAIGGLDLDENGIPELENNECLKVSNPMLLVFLSEVMVDYEITYYEESQTFDIRIMASGGMPAYNSSFYQVSLSNGAEATIDAPFQTVFLEGLVLPENLLSIAVADFAGCLATTEPIAVVIDELSFLENFKIAYFPNHTLQLQFWSLQNQSLQMTLFDLQGRNLGQKNTSLEQGFNAFEWSLEDFPEGIYLLQLSDGRESFVRKVLRF